MLNVYLPPWGRKFLAPRLEPAPLAGSAGGALGPLLNRTSAWATNPVKVIVSPTFTKLFACTDWMYCGLVTALNQKAV